MNASLRLRLCVAILVVSGGYALLIAADRQAAGESATIIGYSVVVLGIFILVNVWRKDERRKRASRT